MRYVAALFCACLTVATAGVEASAAAPAAQPKVYMVVLDGMKFGKVPEVIHPGDMILWVNRDIFQHSVTARNHHFDIDLPTGKMVRQRFNRAGVYPFVCKYHPGMTGQVVVR